MADILLGSAVVTLTLLTFIGKCVPPPEDIIVYKIINQSVPIHSMILLARPIMVARADSSWWGPRLAGAGGGGSCPAGPPGS